MKFGMRRPSPRRSFSARTTGRAKRAVKRAIIPGYGQRGMGWLTNPKKAAYNKIYRKTTFSIFDLLFKTKKSPKEPTDEREQQALYNAQSSKPSCLLVLFCLVSLTLCILSIIYL